MQVALTSVLSVIIVMMFSDRLSGQNVEIDDVQSQRAKTAIAIFNRKVEEAKKEYEDDVSSERDKLVKELETEIKKATSAGNLEEAIKLQSAVDSLKSQKPAPQDSKGESFLGMWKLQYSDGSIRYQNFVVNANALAALRYERLGEQPGAQGPVKLEDGRAAFIHYNNSIYERYSRVADQLLIERWYVNSNKSIDRFPDLLGLGTRVKQSN